MLKKIIIIFISTLFITSSALAVAFEGAVKETIPQEDEERAKQEFEKIKNTTKKELKEIEQYLKDIENTKINISEKNGKKITEVNSDVLEQENGVPLFYDHEYTEEPFYFYAGEPNTFEFKDKLYKFTGHPIFRFRIKNAADNKVDISYQGDKIKVETQGHYVTTDRAIKIQEGAMYSVRAENIEIPINVMPEEALQKVIDGYKDYEIVEANLDFEDSNPYYFIKIKINGKLLWLFQTSFDLTAKINAENGKTEIEKPWWEPFVF